MKTNRKIKNPKISLVQRGIYASEDAKNFDAEYFLLNNDIQDIFFADKKLTVQNILARVWFCRYAERDLIKKKKIEDNNYFFNRIIRIMNGNADIQKEMREFFTMMFFEDNSICSHWNFRTEIDKDSLHKIISNSISANYLSFDLFLDNLGEKELEKIRITLDKEKPQLDIKTKAMKDGLDTWGSNRNRYKNLLNIINEKLNIPDNIELLMKHCSTINYYDLQKMDIPNLNKHIIEHEFDGVKITTTVENLAKYNAMDKGLTSCLVRYAGYDLNGKIFRPSEFEEMVDSFYSDTFLKDRIVNFMMNKSAKAKKKDIKSIWRYNAIKKDVENAPKVENKEKKKIIKV